MKPIIITLFKEIINDSPYPIPLKYFSRLQTLSGLVYEEENDKHMEEELKLLSDYIQYLSNLDKLKEHIGKLFSYEMDCRSMFNAGFDRHYENFQNLEQVTIHFPQAVNFPGMNQNVSEKLIAMVSENFINIKTYDFNVSRIIGWLKTKFELDKNTNNQND